MSSPFASALTKLDTSLETLELLVGRLHAGLPVDEAEIDRMLKDACQDSTTLREAVYSERPTAYWSDRDELQQVIRELELAAEAKRDQDRRSRLTALADELEGGSLKHRFETRTNALNVSRREAVDELRADAGAEAPSKELPGPAVSQWLVWAFNLDDDKDAAMLEQLRTEFPALERFTADMEEEYWKPSQPSLRGVAAEQSRKLYGDMQSDHVTEARSTTAVASEPTSGTRTPSATTVADAPSGGGQAATVAAERARRNGNNDLRATSAAVAELPDNGSRSGEENASSAPEGGPPAHDVVFAELTEAAPGRRLIVGAIAGFVVLIIVFFAVISHFRSASGSKETVEAATARPAPAETQSANGGLLHKQAAEGPQDKIQLSVEKCGRGKPGDIECWGYVSNLGDGTSKISFDRVDVVDGRGNTVTLDRNGQFAFPSGRTSTVAGGASVKYTVKIPDKDQTAKTLTLYLDLNGPRSLEYTFRDVPVVD